jgi:hypothetical protein
VGAEISRTSIFGAVWDVSWFVEPGRSVLFAAPPLPVDCGNRLLPPAMPAVGLDPQLQRHTRQIVNVYLQLAH